MVVEELGGNCGYRRLLVAGLERWGGGERRQQGWLCQSGSRLPQSKIA